MLTKIGERLENFEERRNFEKTVQKFCVRFVKKLGKILQKI